MPIRQTDHLDREIDVFCRYLIGRSADEFVLSRYRQAHLLGALGLDAKGSRFDGLMLRIARTSPVMTRIADAYATVCGGDSLRRKLVLSLGILENSPALHESVTRPSQRSRGLFFVRAGTMALVFAVNVLLGLLLFLPLRWACWLRGNDRASSS